jgi:2-phospho-L-lactate guanylyltransferase
MGWSLVRAPHCPSRAREAEVRRGGCRLAQRRSVEGAADGWFVNKELNIVVPVKDPTGAKERLSGLLSPEQRRDLALILYEGVLALLAETAEAAHRLVITDSDEMAARARKAGAAVLREERAAGETAAVEQAAAWSVAHGFESQLVIPGDLAAPDRDEFKFLLRYPRSHPSVLLCPAVGDDGTNAILTTPPNVIPFRFGARSFPDYRRAAEARGIRCDVLRLKSLVLDLDTPDDVRAFLAATAHTPAHHLLRTWNLAPAS